MRFNYEMLYINFQTKDIKVTKSSLEKLGNYRLINTAFTKDNEIIKETRNKTSNKLHRSILQNYIDVYPEMFV